MDSLPQIKETAALWVARRHGESWTAADAAALEQWLNVSTGHRVEYLSLENRWRDADRLQVLGAGVRNSEDWSASPYFKHLKSRAEPEQPLPQRSAARLPRRRAAAVLVAASVAVAMAGLGWYLAPDGQVYSTPMGVTTAVPLPDGSKIMLNTNSQIRVAVTERERRVILEQGEAYFEVAQDPAHPFVVRAGNKQIVVLGTKFSVRRDGHDVRVVVTEGTVQVSRVGEKAAEAVSPVSLAAGNIAETRDGEVTVRQQSLPRAEELLSWRDGYLVFDEVSLAEAVAEFNRYNTRKFVIQDASVGSVQVSGHFRSTSVEPFARLLEQGFPVSVTRRDDAIVLGAP